MIAAPAECGVGREEQMPRAARWQGGLSSLNSSCTQAARTWKKEQTWTKPQLTECSEHRRFLVLDCLLLLTMVLPFVYWTA